MMPGALHRAIGPGSYRFFAPSLDLATYVIDDTRREWLLFAVTGTARPRRAKLGDLLEKPTTDFWHSTRWGALWPWPRRTSRSATAAPAMIDSSS